MVEEIEVRGHIVDSLLLPKILDRILLMGGTFEIRECKIGVHRTDPSYARIAIQADSHETLTAILGDLVEHGASPIHPEDATIVAADIAGAFPDGFYSTTSQATQVRVKGRWITVDDQEMDCGILVDRDTGQARCMPMARVEIGMPIVVGHAGVRVLPTERSREVSPFGFMNSAVSSEKPKSISVQGSGRCDADDPRRGEEGLAGRGAGDRAYRLGGPRRAADQGGLDPGALRRQCPGDPRHRAGDVRHEPGRLADARRVDRARSRAPSARDQHDPAARAESPGRSKRACSLRESCTSASRRASTWCWPARSATTGRCPR